MYGHGDVDQQRVGDLAQPSDDRHQQAVEQSDDNGDGNYTGLACADEIA